MLGWYVEHGDNILTNIFFHWVTLAFVIEREVYNVSYRLTPFDIHLPHKGPTDLDTVGYDMSIIHFYMIFL